MCLLGCACETLTTIFLLSYFLDRCFLCGNVTLSHLFLFLFYRLNRMIFGMETAFWFHLVNVVLHAIASILFTKICLDVIGLRRKFCLLAGILFAIHPIHTESEYFLVHFSFLFLIIVTRHVHCERAYWRFFFLRGDIGLARFSRESKSYSRCAASQWIRMREVFRLRNVFEVFLLGNLHLNYYWADENFWKMWCRFFYRGNHLLGYFLCMFRIYKIQKNVCRKNSLIPIKYFFFHIT